MTTLDKHVTGPTYYLATDETSVFICGYIEGGLVSTGQPVLKTYATRSLLDQALAGYGQPTYDGLDAPGLYPNN